MGLSDSDRTYLDGSFKEVHKRITESEKELLRDIASVNLALQTHIVTPCKDVKDHIEKKHNPYRQIPVVGSLIVAIGGAWAFFQWLVKAAK